MLPLGNRAPLVLGRCGPPGGWPGGKPDRRGSPIGIFRGTGFESQEHTDLRRDLNGSRGGVWAAVSKGQFFADGESTAETAVAGGRCSSAVGEAEFGGVWATVGTRAGPTTRERMALSWLIVELFMTVTMAQARLSGAIAA